MDLIKIQKKWKKKWSEKKIYNSEPNNKKKFFNVVPYPYPSGAMHLGHARTYTFPDVITRYKRLKGFNSLLPMAWHVTGTPVLAQTELVKKKDPETLKVLKEVCKVKNSELKQLEEPISFVNYFVNKCETGYVNGMNALGLGFDWRRQYTTMDPKYNKFIEWQYLKLKKQGLVVKGSYPVRFCPDDKQAVGDHDLKEGEGVGIQEFTLLKFKIEDYNIIAATLRPETVYGQTNLWVDEKISYYKFKVGKETWLTSKECMEKIEQQGKKVKKIGLLKGKELIGKYALAPGINKEIIILPSKFCNPNIGSGIVTSVPSDAPKDYMALKDLGNKYGKIKLVSIIKTPGFGKFPAKEICEKLKIKSQDDNKLEEATKEVYKAGFYKGVMLTGKFKGKKVSEAKDLVKNFLIKQGRADVLHELEGKVVCRCGCKVIVAVLAGQWFLKYSDEKWKQKVRKHFKKMNIIPSNQRNNFEHTIGWLENKPCARQKGLGTRLPWDKKWIIEPLSDSTIYMAYFTISHMLKDVKVKDMTYDFFEYVFTGKGIGNVKNIPVKKLKELRKSFDYWYPLDYNISAVELVPNHMTFAIFHHVVLFPKSKWIKGEISLGMGNLNGKKMSASKGHVIIVTDISKELGADLVRLFLMNFVEPWQDFDWNTETVTQMSKTLKNKLSEILDLAKEAKSGKLENLTSFDKWILSRTNSVVKEVTSLMDKFLLRKSIQILFFEFLKDLKYYTVLNPQVLHYILSRWAVMMSPFIPYFSEELGERLGTGLVVNSDWPKVEKKYIDETAEALKESSDLLEKDIQKVIGLSGIKTPKVAIIIIADEWKYSLFKEANKIKEFKKLIPTLMKNSSFRKHGQFINKKLPKMFNTGKIPEKVSTAKEEFNLFKESALGISKKLNLRIELNIERESSNNKASNAMPGKPAIILE